MIAADTSSLVSYLAGEKGLDTEVLEDSLRERTLILPPMVLAEVLSSPDLPTALRRFVENIPSVEILDGFWIRAGETRMTLLKKGFKARLGDALIAQFCIDHEMPLITRDQDFRGYQKFFGLRLKPAL